MIAGRTSFERADFAKLAELWDKFHSPRFRVDAELLQANTVGSPVFDWGASCIHWENGVPTGFVAVKRSPAPGLYSGPDQDTYHLSAIAFLEPALGVDLLSYSKRVIAQRGAFALLFGQDTRHFFPGCPCDLPVLCNFLTVEGFEEQPEVFDLERDLQNYHPSPALETALAAWPGGSGQGKASVRTLTDNDVAALASHLQSEFPGRWQYDVLQKVGIEGPETVCGLFEGSELCGFALIQDSTHKLPAGGAVWRGALGSHWGSLGPIGVAKSRRGTGLGTALLSASLLELQRRGCRQTIIDWTTLDRFYGAQGFEVTRRYKPMRLQLG